MKKLILSVFVLSSIPGLCLGMQQSTISVRVELPGTTERTERVLHVMEHKGIRPFQLIQLLCIQENLSDLAKCLENPQFISGLTPEEKHQLLAITCATDNVLVAHHLWSAGFRFIEAAKYKELAVAIVANNWAILEFFRGTDKNIDNNRLLREAIALKNGEFARSLIIHGVDPNVPDFREPFNTPLHVAAEFYPEFMEELFPMMKTLCPQNKWGSSPIHVGAAVGQSKAVAILLNKLVPVDVTDHIGNTPLIRACKAGHVRVVELLLGAQANVRHENGKKETALSVCSNDAVRALILKKLTQAQDSKN